jgi:hypothetical protein
VLGGVAALCTWPDPVCRQVKKHFCVLGATSEIYPLKLLYNRYYVIVDLPLARASSLGPGGAQIQSITCPLALMCLILWFVCNWLACRIETISGGNDIKPVDSMLSSGESRELCAGAFENTIGSHC